MTIQYIRKLKPHLQEKQFTSAHIRYNIHNNLLPMLEKKCIRWKTQNNYYVLKSECKLDRNC